MEFAHHGLFTTLPYLIEFPLIKANAQRNHSRLMLHGNNMPRAQANFWLYLGLDTLIPKEILNTQLNRQITTTENLSRSIVDYESQDAFERIVYLDNAPAAVTAGAWDHADWQD